MANRFWDGATTGGTGDGISQGGTGTWNTTASNTNWDQGAGLSRVAWVNANNDQAYFGGTSGTVTVGIAVSANQLLFTTTDYTVSGTLAVSLTGTTPSIDVLSGGTATISSPLAGSVAWSKLNTGTLVLSGTNTYTAALTISAGTVRATTSASALGTGAATVVMSAGATLSLANNTALSFSRATTISGNATVESDVLSAQAGVTHTMGTLSIGAFTLSTVEGINVTSGVAGITFGATTLTGAATFNTGVDTNLTLGAIGGAFGITKSGPGQLTLSSISTRTTAAGTTTLSAGTLRLTVASALNTLATAPFTFSGGILNLASDANITFNGTAQTISGNVEINFNRVTAGGAVTFTTSTVSIGANTLSLSAGANFTTGSPTWTPGAITQSGAATITSSTTVNMALGAINLGGFRLTLSTLGTITQSVAWSGSGGITYSAQSAGSSLTLSQSGNTNSGGITVDTLGTLILSASGATATNQITLVAGTIRISHSAGTFPGITVTGSSNIDMVTTGSNLSQPIGFSNGATLSITSAASQTISGTVSGAGNLNITGASGTYAISSALNHTGTTTLVGTVSLTSTASTNTNTLNLSNGTFTLSNNALLSNPVSLGASGTISALVSLGGTRSGAITLVAGTNTIRAGSTSTATTTLSGGVTGPGDIYLEQASFSWFLNTSTASINNDGFIFVTGSGSGQVNFQGPIGSNSSGVYIQNSSAPITISGGINVKSSGTTISTTGGTTSITGGATGSGSLYISSSGTINISTVSMNNTGSLQLDASNTPTSTINLTSVIGSNVTAVFITGSNSGFVNLGVATTTSVPFTIGNGGIAQLSAVETPGTSGPLGNGGPINMTGGMLKHTATNTNFDYSSRISATSVDLNLDTNGNNVIWGSLTPPIAYSIRKYGSGTWSINNVTLNPSTILVSAGVLSFNTSLSTSSTVSFSLSGSPQLNIPSTGMSVNSLFTGNSAAVISLGAANLTITNGANQVYGGIFTGTGAIIKTGTGNAGLSSSSISNTFSGGVFINEGILTLTGVFAAGPVTNVIRLGNTSGSSTATLAASGTIGATYLMVRAGSSGQAILDSGSASGVFNGPIELARNLTLLSSNTTASLSLGGNISGTGNINVGASSTNSLTLSGSINNTGTFVNNTPAQILISGQLGLNLTSLTNSGSTTSYIALSGDNSLWSGNIIVSSGYIDVRSNNALGANSSARTIQLGASTSGYLNFGSVATTVSLPQVSVTSTANSFGIIHSGTFDASLDANITPGIAIKNTGSGNFTLANNTPAITNAGAVKTVLLYPSSTGNITVAKNITGNIDLEVNLIAGATGSVVLSGTNSYSGQTSLFGNDASGRVVVETSGGLGTGSLTLYGGATGTPLSIGTNQESLSLTNTSYLVLGSNSFTKLGATAGIIDLGTSPFTISGTSGETERIIRVGALATLRIGGPITSNLSGLGLHIDSLGITATGTVEFYGDSSSTYFWDTVINNGTLLLSGSFAPGTNFLIRTEKNASLDLFAKNVSYNVAFTSVNNISGTAYLKNGTITNRYITLSGQNGTAEVTATLAGTSSVMITSGSSTIKLLAENSFTGGVTINSGGNVWVNSDSGLGSVPASPAISISLGSQGKLVCADNLILNSNRLITSSTSVPTAFGPGIGVEGGKTVTYGGSISGSAAVAKYTAGGTLIITGQSTSTSRNLWKMFGGFLEIGVNLGNYADVSSPFGVSEFSGQWGADSPIFRINSLTTQTSNRVFSTDGNYAGMYIDVPEGNDVTLTGLPSAAKTALYNTNAAVATGDLFISAANLTSTKTVEFMVAGTMSLGANLRNFFNGSASGAWSYTKSGTGILNINGTGNTYTGTFRANGGTVNFGSGATFGAPTAPLRISAGTVNFSGSSFSTGALTIDGASSFGDGTINPASTSITNASGIADVWINIAGGTISKSGAGTAILTGVNTTTAATTLSAGVLRGYMNTKAFGSGTITISGGELQTGDNAGIPFGNNVVVSGISTITLDRFSTGSGHVTTFGTLNRSSANTLTIQKGPNVDSGTAELVFGATSLTASASVFSLGASTKLTLGSITGTNTAFTVSGSGDLNVTGVIAVGTGVPSFTTSGTTTLSSATANTYTATTIINNGTVVLSGGATLGASTSGITMNTATLNLGTRSVTNGALALTASNITNGTITPTSISFSSGGASSISAKITSGTVSVSSTATLSNDNTGMGAITIGVNGLLIARSFATVLGTTAGITFNSTNSALTVESDTNLALNRATTVSGTGAIANITPDVLTSGSTSNISHTLGTLSLGTNTVQASSPVNTTGIGEIIFGAVTLTATNATLRALKNATTGATGKLTVGSISGNTFNTSFTGGGLINVTGIIGTTTGTVLINSPGGTVTFSGQNTYTGLTTITAGTLAYGASNVTGSGGITINGGTLDIGSNSDIIGALTISSGSFVSTTGTLSPTSIALQGGTINGILTGSGAIAVTSGTTTVSSANTTSGNVTLTSGSLKIDNDAALGTSAIIPTTTGNLDSTNRTINNNITLSSTLNYSGVSGNLTQQAGSVTITTATQTINVASNTFTINGGISGAFGLTKSGAGTLVLGGANTFTGTITASAGILTIASTATFSANNAMVLSGGVINILPASPGFGALSISAATTLSSSTSLSYTGITSTLTTGIANITANLIVTTSGIAHTGTGTLTLAGSNSITGNITTSNGTFRINNNAALGSAILTISSGTIDTEASASISNALSLSGNFTFAGTTNLTQSSGAITLGATRTITTTAGVLTLGGIIGGSTFGITKAGAGTLALTANNTYNGAVTINAGILSVPSIGAGSASSPLGASASSGTNLVINGGTLQWTGSANETTARAHGLGTSGGSIDASGTGALTLSTAPTISAAGSRNLTLTGTGIAENTYSAILSNGSGTLSIGKSGAGQWVLNSANTFSGGVTVSAGLLKATNATSLGISSSVGTIAVSAGGQLWITAATSYASRLLTINGTALNPISNYYGALVLGAGLTLNNAIILDANSAITATTSLAMATGINMASNSLTVYLASASVVTISGSLTGTSAASSINVISDSIDSVINPTFATSSFTQGISISNATLRFASIANIGVNSSLGAGNDITLRNGALEYNGTVDSSTNRSIAITNFATGSYSLIKNTSTKKLTIGTIYSSSLTADTTLVFSSSDVSGVTSVSNLGEDTTYKTNLLINNVGTTILAGTSNLSGSLTLQSGTLSIENFSALGTSTDSVMVGGPSVSSPPTLTVNSNNLASISTSRNFTPTGSVNNYFSIIDNSGINGSTTFSGNIIPDATVSGAYTIVLSGSSTSSTMNGAIQEFSGGSIISINKTGTGTWKLMGANQYAGNTTLNNGTLMLGSDSVLSSSSLTINGGELTSNNTNVRNVTTNQSVLITNSTSLSYLTLNDPIVISNNPNISSNDNLTFSGVISGSSCITFSSSGKVYLNATNTFSSANPVTLQQGEFVLNGAETVTGGPFGYYSAPQTGTLLFTGTSILVHTATNTSDYSSRFSNTGDQSWGIDTNGQNVTWSSSLTGTDSSLYKKGAGTLSLNASNSYTGGTNIVGGSLALNASGSLSGSNITAFGSAITSNATLVQNSSIVSTTLVNSSYTHTTFGNTEFFGDIKLLESSTIASTQNVNINFGNASIIFFDNSSNVISAPIRSSAGAIAFIGTLSGPTSYINPGLTISNNISELSIPLNLSTNQISSGSSHILFSGTSTYTGITSIANDYTRFRYRTSLYNATTTSWIAANIQISSGSTLALNVGGLNEFTSSDVSLIASLGSSTGGFQSGSFIGIDTSNSTYSVGVSGLSDTNSGANSLGISKVGGTTLTILNNTFTGAVNLRSGGLRLGNTVTTINLYDGSSLFPGIRNIGTLNCSVVNTTGGYISYRIQGTVGSATLSNKVSTDVFNPSTVTTTFLQLPDVVRLPSGVYDLVTYNNNGSGGSTLSAAQFSKLTVSFNTSNLSKVNVVLLNTANKVQAQVTSDYLVFTGAAGPDPLTPGNWVWAISGEPGSIA